MQKKTPTATTQATLVTAKTFKPSGKVVAAATPVVAKTATIDCPGTGFVCLNGKYTFGKHATGLHFACGGKGKFDLTRPDGKTRVYVVTAKEAKHELFPEWLEWASKGDGATLGFTFRVSNKS